MSVTQSLTHGFIQGEYFGSGTVSESQSVTVSSAVLQSTCSNSYKFKFKDFSRLIQELLNQIHTKCTNEININTHIDTK